jgi:peptidoglycan/xylan/chitin deacetylase (PgdA/CDA1 family)
MKLLHNVGTFKHSNYNTREQIAACKEQLSFDGVYLNVWENRDLLLNRKQPTILFVMWNYIGKDNMFDVVANNNKLPYEKYCDLVHLFDLEENYNCIIASHSWTHVNMTKMTDDAIRRELTTPGIAFKEGKRYFAYPYGDVDDRVARLVKEAGYDDAWSVHQGNGGPFQRNRTYL